MSPEKVVPDPTDASIADAWAVLKHHSKGRTFIETVNRLFGEKAKLHGKVAPTLKEAELRVRREWWFLDRLWSLLHPSQIVDVPPDQEVVPVVVMSSGGHFLIDGRRRINLWKRSNSEGPHQVLRIARGTEPSNGDI
jgi:hypothetical protein